MSWIETTIGQLGRVVTGKTPPTDNPAMYGGDCPFVTPTDLEWDSYSVLSTHSTVTELAKEKHKNQLIPEGSTVVTCIGNTIGKTGITSEESLTNQQINSIIASDEHDSRFIYYLMIHNRPQIRSVGLSGGAAQPIINKSTFSALMVRIPGDNLAETRIASILSAYDALIENNRRRIALLEEAARLLYREWFVYLRFPGHEHTKIIDGVPEGWKKTTLSDLVDWVKESVKPANFQEDDVHIGLEHIPRRSFTLNDWEAIEGLASHKFRFKKGDVIFGKIRPYFHKVGFSICDGLASSDAFIWRSKRPELWPLVVCSTSSDYFVAVASKTVKEGSKMPRADWSVLASFLIPTPPDGILADFNSKIEPATSQCTALSLANRELIKARDLLLPRLMDGRIEV